MTSLLCFSPIRKPVIPYHIFRIIPHYCSLMNHWNPLQIRPTSVRLSRALYKVPWAFRWLSVPALILVEDCFRDEIIFSLWVFEFPSLQNLKQEPITKARNLESTPVKWCWRNFTGQAKKGLFFYITPSSFVFSPFRVFVIRGCLKPSQFKIPKN